MAQQQPQQTSGKSPKDCQECGCRCESCSSTGHGRSSILTTTTNTDGTIGPSSSSSGPSSVSTAQQSFNNSSTQSKHGTGDNVVVHLYQEIENLKRQISERDYHIVQMETTVMNHAKEYPNGEFEALQETLRFWQEKYERLFESHRKLQKVNQALEDKLLRIVDKFETEKAALTRDVADLTTKLVEARVLITELEEESELYKNDCNIAVQLLQCKPSNFVSHKVNSLPSDIQEKVRLHFGNSNNHRRSRSIPSALSQQAAANHHHLNTGQYHQLQSVSSSSSNNGNNNNINNNDFLGSGGRGNQVSSPNGAKIIRVPIPTFPPTAMVYSVNKVQQNSNGNTAGNGHQNGSSGSNPDGTPDYVSAAIMAKVLEERSKERNLKTGTRYQKCFQCRNRRVTSMYYDETTQTTDGHITPEDFTNYPWSYWNSNSSGSENNNKRRSRNESSDSGNSLDSLGNHHLHGAQLSHQQQHQQQQHQHQSQQYYQYQQQPSQQQQQQLSQQYPQQHQTITSSYSSSSINSSSGSNSSTGNNYYGNTTTGAVVTTVKKKSNETIII